MASRVLARNISKLATRTSLRNNLNCIQVCRLCTYKDDSPYEFGKHRSNAEELINKIPVIEVDGHTAVCDGGSGALGHPTEFIQLNNVNDGPAVCKYCGLRYKKKAHAHGHH